MVSRRAILGVCSAGIAGTMAGCTDQLPFLGDDPIEFSAQQASVPQHALDETGYEEHEVEEVVLEKTFEAGGRSQDVIVRNWQAEYDKSMNLSGVDIPLDEEVRAGTFTALTTPQVSVLGRSFNPVANMSPTELAEMVQDQYDGLGNIEHVTDDSVTIAGESTTVSEFEGEGELAGSGMTIDLTLHIAEAVEAGDDLIVAIGGYPTRMQDGEQGHVITMMEGIEHEG